MRDYKVKLLVVAPHRYGPGKIHLAIRNAGANCWLYSCSSQVITHGDLRDGKRSEVTCKRCGVTRVP